MYFSGASLKHWLRGTTIQESLFVTISFAALTRLEITTSHSANATCKPHHTSPLKNGNDKYCTARTRENHGPCHWLCLRGNLFKVLGYTDARVLFLVEHTTGNHGVERVKDDPCMDGWRGELRAGVAMAAFSGRRTRYESLLCYHLNQSFILQPTPHPPINSEQIFAPDTTSIDEVERVKVLH